MDSIPIYAQNFLLNEKVASSLFFFFQFFFYAVVGLFGPEFVKNSQT